MLVWDEKPFFDYARERHNVYLKRTAGEPRPWTDDPIIATCRFTNVYRELDKTTVWFKNQVREPLRSRPEVLLATVLFRWLNRITTGEALFLQTFITDEGDVHTAFEKYLIDGNLAHLKYAILAYCGDGPYVTGAFIINTPTGMTKLDGVLWAFDQFAKRSNWREVAISMLKDIIVPGESKHSMEGIHEWLKQFPRLGDFMSYEVVCDLRFTGLLDHAPDINTWANPGPGAKRGLSYLLGGARKVVPPEVKSRGQQIELMRNLLEIAPQYGWTDWEMREVEHTLCEFAKYQMVLRGEGKTKGMFK